MWAWIRHCVFWGYAAVWTTLLLVPDPMKFFGLSEVVPESATPTILPVDKMVHVAGYFTLTVVALGAFGLRPINFSHPWIVAVCAAHGMLTELGQMFVPPRVASVADWFGDIAGVAMGLLVFEFFRRARRQQAGRLTAEQQRESVIGDT